MLKYGVRFGHLCGMNYADLRQYFYGKLTSFYTQGELLELYHWCVECIDGFTRTQAYLHNDATVTKRQKRAWDKAIDRLANLEPVQYVFGKAYFLALELTVTPAVLIPRPETEELVSLVLAREGAQNLSILDVGTGSGCIALALKHHRPDWHVSGLDVSEAALMVARRNAHQRSLDVHFFNIDVSTASALPKKTDIIVSNPPYIPIEIKHSLDATVIDFEPSLALFAPVNDPIYFYKKIAELASREGVKSVYFETHATEMDVLISAVGSFGYHAEVCMDLSGKPRFLILSK